MMAHQLHRSVLASVVIGAAAWGGVAEGAYITGFETSDDAGYVVGDSFVGVDGWAKFGTNAPPDDRYQVQDALVQGGSQAATVSYVSGDTSNRIARNFSSLGAEGGQVQVSFAMAVTGSAGAASFIYIGTDLFPHLNNFDYVAAQVGFSGNQVQVRNGASSLNVGTFSYGEYYDVDMLIDMDSSTWDVSITGPGVAYVGTGLAFRGGSVDEISTIALLNNSVDPLHVDTISIVPEPVTIGLIGMGLLAASMRRRRLTAR